ncbi:hypothetical protein HEQ72_10875 [Haematospirillum sp. 15-248]|uniref:hypothetical protein n=1 Tax=Haematospirillum sp. 15-248 TaxID=2723107 RepID=UPI00143ACBFD|nr:hypothetical protein [Haematospirillum sp. 15-248]NKD88802.1 hypothetical protein [Haematospirillum sp. 15-248]
MMSFFRRRLVRWIMVATLVWLGVTLFPVAKRAVWIYQEIREYNAWAEQFQKERGVDPLPVTLRHKDTPEACYDLTHGGVRYCLPQQRFKRIKFVDARNGSTSLYGEFRSRIADPQGYGDGNILFSKEVNHPKYKTITYPESVLISRFNSNIGTEDWGNPDLIRSLTDDPARQDRWTQVDPVYCTGWDNERCFSFIRNQRIYAEASIKDNAKSRISPSSDYRLDGDLKYQEPGSNVSYDLSYSSNTGTEDDLIATMMALLEEFRAIERAAILD